MKTAIRQPLAAARQLVSRTVAIGTPASVYLDLLADAVGRAPVRQRAKARVAVKTFQRWIVDHGLDAAADFDANEGMLIGLQQDMASGAFKREDSGRYSASSTRQVVEGIARLHNLVHTHDPRVLRALAHSRSTQRFAFFNALTPLTQSAILWFEQKGCRPARPGMPGGGDLLTESTRLAAISEAFTVLRRLNLNGLELVTGQHVQQFLGSPDPNDSGYRRRVRTLHNLRPVYRSCAAHGLLPDDPLKDITNRTFDAYAQRDFLPPDELARLRDLTTVDMDNWQQVRDRLVCLLYADTALRRTELANVDSSQVHRLPDGNCEIILRPAGQKMTGKPGVNQQILYPETQKLLDFYLTRIRPKFGSDGLIVDEKGHRASEHACSAAVQREAQRLALKTYYGKGPPTPHALRRTFGTCNAKPLGLAMDVAEIAEHLRDGVQVVYQHYIVRNPLRARSRGAAYRKQGSPQSVPQGNVDAALAVLQNCGTSAAHLAAIRAELQKRRQPELVPITGKPDHLVQWATEEEAFLLLSTAWAAMPRPRDLRSYLRRQGVCKPVGKRGELLYDRDAVAQLADGYRPWQANGLTRGWTRLNLRRLLNEYSAVRMGGVRLFKREVLVQIKERLVEKLES